jgi:hypothetical protein
MYVVDMLKVAEIKCFTPTSVVMVVKIEKIHLAGTDHTSAITPRSRGSV